ncbi:MAG: thioredoxin domain-containing protein [Acidobacteriota bacterium]|nr:thioredoxin domain-containing protein [Acidobacteriota bacterium]
MSSETLNSLSKASSAYLRSAMRQPIQWHEWGEEAFAAALRHNKPILLDIGAVWCHWCHVMDRESYDDPEVAKIVNERFVAVKVDRDERPDIDSRYQVAVSAISGQGGWPLTAFLTPEGKPYFGGTYFPPDDHYGRPSFKRVLIAISDAYREKTGDVTDQAKLVESSIAQAESLAGRSGTFTPSVVTSIVKSAMASFDATNGGFSHAPKFPHPAVLDLLIDQYLRTGDEQIKNVFVTTLEKMALGGVYDQLAGGFHRYSVDEHWIVPHFEKMCYDNSELLKNYLHAYQATGSEFFATVARDIIRWMDEWLSDREKGGFYGSQDADYSMDDDGDYFTWTLQEAQSVLTEEEARVASLHYDINEIGEMHHNPAKNVLYIKASVEEISRRLNLSLDEVETLLHQAKEKMYAARLMRPTPYVDKTVYVGWNALCSSAYFEAGKVLAMQEAKHFALRSLDRILSEAWDDDQGLKHVIAYSEAQAQGQENSDHPRAKTAVAGLLDDYAFTAVACLDAYEATADLTYFNFGSRVVEAMINRFFDPVAGGFFDTNPSSADGEKILGVLGARRKPFQDSPTPAGNSVAAIALLRLHAYTNDENLRDKAEQTMEVLAKSAGQYGIFAATYGIAGVLFSDIHTQVIVIGNGEPAAKLYAAAMHNFAFGKSVLRFNADKVIPQNLPTALAKTLPEIPAIRAGLKDGEAIAVVCSNFTCLPPISDPDELSRLLKAGPGKKSHL